ncbi:MAG: hypothetical protein WCT85_00745 [Parachlamydiales bacterium]|jgi:hypothetical protein
MNWIDYTILNNSSGVISVLKKHGYNITEEDIERASYDLVQKSEQGTIDLLKVHPDYEVLTDIKTGFRNFEETETENKPANLKDEILQAIRLDNIEKRWQDLNSNFKILIAVAIIIILMKVLEKKN